MTALYTIIVFLSFAGFLISGYVREKKLAKKTLVCPLKADCDTVIHSDYSRFWGIPVEFLGLIYYGIVAVGYGAFVVVPALAISPVVFALLMITVVAFCFSVYLTFLQAFVIRQWCSWCLVSAGLCTLIFILAVSASEFGFISLLLEYQITVGFVYLIAIALGLGAATVTDVLFLRFLRDLRISKEESEVLHMTSEVVWFALAAILVSGIGLYLPEVPGGIPDIFLLQALVFVIIVINSAFLHFLIAKRLIGISLGESHGHREGELRSLHQRAFALGAVSLASWYSLFFLGAFDLSRWNAFILLGAYLLLLFIVVEGSQLLERFLREREG